MHTPLKERFVTRKVKQAILYSQSKLKDKDRDVFYSVDTTVARNRALMQLKKNLMCQMLLFEMETYIAI